MNLHFYKYQGTGNDFLILDGRENGLADKLQIEDVSAMCARRWGVGADGLIILEKSTELGIDFIMRYYNSDGRESTMCGNGGRCLVAFASFIKVVDDSCTFRAIDGLHRAKIENDLISLEMSYPGEVSIADEDAYWLDTGSPHYVKIMKDSIKEGSIIDIARPLRHDKRYDRIGGTNVNLINIFSPDSIYVRTFERGVEDETFSCGTGVTACAIVAKRLYPEGGNKVKVETPGGELEVEVDTENKSLWLTGPAKMVFEGSVSV